jgi:hypothetical protein
MMSNPMLLSTMFFLRRWSDVVVQVVVFPPLYEGPPPAVTKKVEDPFPAA